jgi:hypothetical protein
VSSSAARRATSWPSTWSRIEPVTRCAS